MAVRRCLCTDTYPCGAGGPFYRDIGGWLWDTSQADPTLLVLAEKPDGTPVESSWDIRKELVENTYGPLHEFPRRPVHY